MYLSNQFTTITRFTKCQQLILNKLVMVALIERNILCTKVIRLLLPAPDKRQHMLAFTNGKNIYIGNIFWKKTISEQYFIVCHEFLHIVLNHVERVNKYKFKLMLYNIASDIVINNLLGRRGLTIPDFAITYSTFKVPPHLETTELIYNWLLENKPDLSCDVMNIDIHSDDIQEDKEVSNKIDKLITDAKKQENINTLLIKEQIVTVPQTFCENLDWLTVVMCEIGRLAIRTYEKNYYRPPRILLPKILQKGGRVYQYIPKVNIVIDVSGSMGNNPTLIASKICAAQTRLKIFQPRYYWLNEDIGEIDDIRNIRIGGGTNLANVTKISGADISILITDCEDANGMKELNTCNKRLIIVTNQTSIQINDNPIHKQIFTTMF